jgi:hypothetical protein
MAIDAGEGVVTGGAPMAFPGHEKLRNLMPLAPAAAGAARRSGRIE